MIVLEYKNLSIVQHNSELLLSTYINSFTIDGFTVILSVGGVICADILLVLDYWWLRCYCSVPMLIKS